MATAYPVSRARQAHAPQFAPTSGQNTTAQTAQTKQGLGVPPGGARRRSSSGLAAKPLGPCGTAPAGRPTADLTRRRLPATGRWLRRSDPPKRLLNSEEYAVSAHHLWLRARACTPTMLHTVVHNAPLPPSTGAPCTTYRMRCGAPCTTICRVAERGPYGPPRPTTALNILTHNPPACTNTFLDNPVTRPSIIPSNAPPRSRRAPPRATPPPPSQASPEAASGAADGKKTSPDSTWPGAGRG